MSGYQAELAAADINARLDAMALALIAIVCSKGDVEKFLKILVAGSEQFDVESATKEEITRMWEKTLLLNEKLRLRPHESGVTTPNLFSSD